MAEPSNSMGRLFFQFHWRPERPNFERAMFKSWGSKLIVFLTWHSSGGLCGKKKQPTCSIVMNDRAWFPLEISQPKNTHLKTKRGQPPWPTHCLKWSFVSLFQNNLPGQQSNRRLVFLCQNQFDVSAARSIFSDEATCTRYWWEGVKDHFPIDDEAGHVFAYRRHNLCWLVLVLRSYAGGSA